MSWALVLTLQCDTCDAEMTFEGSDAKLGYATRAAKALGWKVTRAFAQCQECRATDYRDGV